MSPSSTPDKKRRLESADLETPSAGEAPRWSVPIERLVVLLAPWTRTHTIELESGLVVAANVHAANLLRAAIAPAGMPVPSQSARLNLARAALCTFVLSFPVAIRGRA